MDGTRSGEAAAWRRLLLSFLVPSTVGRGSSAGKAGAQHMRRQENDHLDSPNIVVVRGNNRTKDSMKVMQNVDWLIGGQECHVREQLRRLLASAVPVAGHVPYRTDTPTDLQRAIKTTNAGRMGDSTSKKHFTRTTNLAILAPPYKTARTRGQVPRRVREKPVRRAPGWFRSWRAVATRTPTGAYDYTTNNNEQASAPRRAAQRLQQRTS